MLKLLPLFAIGPFIYAGMVKLAALAYGRAKLLWQHALAFGAIAMFIGAACMFLSRAGDGAAPPSVASLLNVVLQVVVGAWFFGPRVFTRAGEPFAFRRGALLMLLAYALAGGLSLVAALVMIVTGVTATS